MDMPKDFIFFINSGLQFTHNLWVDYRTVQFGVFLGNIIDKYGGIIVKSK